MASLTIRLEYCEFTVPRFTIEHYSYAKSSYVSITTDDPSDYSILKTLADIVPVLSNLGYENDDVSIISMIKGVNTEAIKNRLLSSMEYYRSHAYGNGSYRQPDQYATELLESTNQDININETTKGPVDYLRKHMEIYSNHPNFYINTPKNHKKVSNYIVSVLGDEFDDEEIISAIIAEITRVE